MQEEILWASWQGLFRRQADVPLGQLDQRIGVFIHQFYGQTGGIGGGSVKVVADGAAVCTGVAAGALQLLAIRGEQLQRGAFGGICR